jgi:hypothetical protein
MTTNSFLFLFAKQTNPNQTGGQQYSDTSPLSIPCIGAMLRSFSQLTMLAKGYSIKVLQWLDEARWPPSTSGNH